ncbi:MAG: two-component sensor histidine kinase [Roseibium sp.]|nr:two-component sensor histidine kinase [Roseibium sp.]
MTDREPKADLPAGDYQPVTPLMRLRDGRWPLVASAVLLILAILVYGVPLAVGGAAIAVLTIVTAYMPRQTRLKPVSVRNPRQLRRMWPGTGMKVTVDALASPCFVADGRGITRYVNKAAAKYYGGVRPGDPLSFSLRAPSLLEAFDRVCSTGSAERITWTDKVPTEAWFEAHLAPIYMPGSAGAQDRSGPPDFVLVVVADLTEQRRLERMRTDFVANASHELRTPLASLTGFIETLQGPAKEDPEARDRFLGIMAQQAGRMRRLIDDILSLSRIELKAHVRPEALVDLSEIVRHTNDALAPLARELDVTVETLIPEGPATVRGDRDELIQVAENLIENALKYGVDGEKVAIEVALEFDTGGTQNWVMRVRDYGPGIAPEHVPRLTERFYRADVASSRATKGTGLGLAIVKHILTRHQARLEIDSTEGEGSTFTVKIPAAGE